MGVAGGAKAEMADQHGAEGQAPRGAKVDVPDMQLDREAMALAEDAMKADEEGQ